MWRDQRFGSIVAELAVKTAQTPSAEPTDDQIERLVNSRDFTQQASRLPLFDFISAIYDLKWAGSFNDSSGALLQNQLDAVMDPGQVAKRPRILRDLTLGILLAEMARDKNPLILRPIKQVLAPFVSVAPSDAEAVARLKSLSDQYVGGLAADQKTQMEKTKADLTSTITELDKTVMSLSGAPAPAKATPRNKPATAPTTPSPTFSPEINRVFEVAKAHALEAANALVQKHGLDKAQATDTFNRDIIGMEGELKTYLTSSGVTALTAGEWIKIASNIMLASFLARTRLAEEKEKDNFKAVVDSLNSTAKNWQGMRYFAHIRKLVGTGFGLSMDSKTAGNILARLHAMVKEAIQRAMKSVKNMPPAQQNVYNQLVGSQSLMSPNQVDAFFQSALLSPAEVGKTTKFNTAGTHAYALQLVEEASRALGTSRNREEALPRIVNALMQRIESWGSFTGRNQPGELPMEEPLKPPTAAGKFRIYRLGADPAGATMPATSPATGPGPVPPPLPGAVPVNTRLPPQVVREQIMKGRTRGTPQGASASSAWLQPDVISLASCVLYQLLKLYMGRASQY